MGILTASETAAWLRQHDHYTILTHRRPDGDTLGSAALLCRGLRAIGKTAHVLHNPETTPKYRFVVEGLTKPKEAEGDTILCVDVAIPGLLPDAFMHLADKIDLRIDHHRNNGPFTTHEYNDAIRASCAQVVYDVLEELGVGWTSPWRMPCMWASPPTPAASSSATPRTRPVWQALCAPGSLPICPS